MHRRTNEWKQRRSCCDLLHLPHCIFAFLMQDAERLSDIVMDLRVDAKSIDASVIVMGQLSR